MVLERGCERVEDSSEVGRVDEDFDDEGGDGRCRSMTGRWWTIGPERLR